MTAAQKAIFCLFLSAILVVSAVMFARMGIFDLIGNRFYNPAVSKMLILETTRDAKLLSGLLLSLQNQFSSFLSVPAIRRSFLSNRDTADVYQRSRLFDLLLESIPSLYSVRFIDSAGNRMFFSTHSSDIAYSDSLSLLYRNYHEDPASLPFEEINVPAFGQPKITLDKTGNRIFFSFPFFDYLDNYQGVALFTVSSRIIADTFSAAGRESAGEDIVLAADPDGFISGISGEEIIKSIPVIWKEKFKKIVPFNSDGVRLALISVRMDQGYYFGRVVDESILVFSWPVKILVLTILFLIVLLIIIFIFNFRRKYLVRQSLDIPLDTELLPHTESDIQDIHSEVIMEQDGIHYINRSAVEHEKKADEKVDGDLIKLVESVIGRK